MSSISSVCSPNTSATTTRIARILDWGREHRALEFAPQPPVASSLMSDWEGCIIVTIGLPRQALSSKIARPNSIPYIGRSTGSQAAATEDFGSGGFLQAVAKMNHAIFG